MELNHSLEEPRREERDEKRTYLNSNFLGVHPPRRRGSTMTAHSRSHLLPFISAYFQSRIIQPERVYPAAPIENQSCFPKHQPNKQQQQTTTHRCPLVLQRTSPLYRASHPSCNLDLSDLERCSALDRGCRRVLEGCCFGLHALGSALGKGSGREREEGTLTLDVETR